MSGFSGPMFEPAEDPFRKSVHGKQGGHYNIFGMKSEDVGIEFLKSYFPNGVANELNFVLFSTSGIHGSYIHLEEIEEGLRKYGDSAKSNFEADGEDWPDDYAGDRLTFLLVQPRIVGMTYGNLVVRLEDIDFLKSLRDSSWKAVSEIGRWEAQS